VFSGCCIYDKALADIGGTSVRYCAAVLVAMSRRHQLMLSSTLRSQQQQQQQLNTHPLHDAENRATPQRRNEKFISGGVSPTPSVPFLSVLFSSISPSLSGIWDRCSAANTCLVYLEPILMVAANVIQFLLKEI